MQLCRNAPLLGWRLLVHKPHMRSDHGQPDPTSNATADAAADPTSNPAADSTSNPTADTAADPAADSTTDTATNPAADAAPYRIPPITLADQSSHSATHGATYATDLGTDHLVANH